MKSWESEKYWRLTVAKQAIKKDCVLNPSEKQERLIQCYIISVFALMY